MTASPAEVLSYWPETYLRPGLSPDHCADVLEGAYDVPYDPPVGSPPPTILDIGGNVGAYLRWATRRWLGCTIHSYEPHPENFALLSATKRDLITPEAAATVHLHNSAVWSSATQTVLTPGIYNCGEPSIHSGRTGVPGSILLTTLDAATLPPAQILKIDAEGSELGILQRMSEAGTLASLQSVALEWHSSSLSAATEALLTAAGFVVCGRRVAAEHRGETKYVRKAPLLPFAPAA